MNSSFESIDKDEREAWRNSLVRRQENLRDKALSIGVDLKDIGAQLAYDVEPRDVLISAGYLRRTITDLMVLAAELESVSDNMLGARYELDDIAKLSGYATTEK